MEAKEGIRLENKAGPAGGQSIQPIGIGVTQVKAARTVHYTTQSTHYLCQYHSDREVNEQTNIRGSKTKQRICTAHAHPYTHVYPFGWIGR